MSADRQILRGFSFAFLFLLVAKVIGALKEMVVAHAYGTGSAVDAYALGFALVQTPITLTAMVGNMVLIPLFVAQRHGALPGRQAGLGGGVLIGAAILSFGTALGVYGMMRFGGAAMGLDQAAAAALRTQAAGLALTVPTGIGTTLLAARLMAAKRQINSLFEAVPSLAVILGLVLFEGRIAADPLLAWTTCLGMTGYLGALFLADRGARARGQDGGGGPVALRERAGEIGIIFAAQTVYVLGGMALDQLAAAQLPEGQNAVLAYANRLLMLGASLGATAVGRAVLPVLAEARLAGQDQRLTARWAGFLFLGGLAAWAIGHTIAPFGIRLLFEHGQFTADDTAAVARVLRIGLMILPAYFASLILSQSVVVQRRFGLLLASNLTAVGVKFLVLALFLDGGGLSAIMAANLAMQLTALLMLTSALRPVKRGKRRGDEA